MSFKHVHHPYPHPSPTPGTLHASLVPPMDSDLEPSSVNAIPTCLSSGCTRKLDIFSVASLPPGIRLPLSSRQAGSVQAVLNKRVLIAHAQSMLAIHAVRGLLKDHVDHKEDKSIEVYAMVQDTESPEARDIKALGATLLQYDPASSSSIRSAIGQSGSSTLLLIPPQVDDTVIRTASILTEARHSIKSIILWSSIGTDDAMDLPPDDGIDLQQLAFKHDKLTSSVDPRCPSSLLLLKEVEELVMHIGKDIAYIVLQAGFPLQHFFLLSALIQNRGSIPFPSDTAHMAPISLADLGRATSILIHRTLELGSLPDDGKNKTLLLTGPEPLSGPMIVTAANERLPHPLTFAKVGISDMRSFLLQTRASRFELSLAMSWWRLFMDGKLDRATGDLSDMLGGPERVTKIAEFFEKHVDRFLPTHGVRVGMAMYAHETYDEWDEVANRRESSSGEQGLGRGSSIKLVSMVLQDVGLHADQFNSSNKSTAGKCISDTQHAYFSAAASARPALWNQPSLSTKVIWETCRSSPTHPSLDASLLLASRIVADFYIGLEQVMHSTNHRLLCLPASMPQELVSDTMKKQVQVLIDRLAFIKTIVNAWSRETSRALTSDGQESGLEMVSKVLADVDVFEECSKSTRLVNRVVGHAGCDDPILAVIPGEAEHEDGEVAGTSQVGVFSKVMHDVSKLTEVGKECSEQPQQWSCIIQ